MASKSQKVPAGRRVAIVRGLRTPFLKQGSLFANLTALDLAQLVVQELVQRTDLDPALIESCEEDVGYDARISADEATVTEPVTAPEPTPEPEYTEEPPKRGKRAVADPGAISRAEEILKEFGK